MIIPKITLDGFSAFGNTELEKELKSQETAAENAWSEIYNRIANAKNDIAYWDSYHCERPGYHSFMRYALHRSPKHSGFLQLSVMEIRNGDIIPTSDSQHGNANSFLKRVADFNGVSVTIGEAKDMA